MKLRHQASFYIDKRRAIYMYNNPEEEVKIEEMTRYYINKADKMIIKIIC